VKRAGLKLCKNLTHGLHCLTMAIRTILHYPDAQLRVAGKKVVSFDQALWRLIDDMSETMYAAPGVGLAATQIAEYWQVFVVDCAPEGEPSDLRVFVNPEILSQEGAYTSSEGCLSFPAAREDIERAEKVRVRAKTEAEPISSWKPTVSWPWQSSMNTTTCRGY